MFVIGTAGHVDHGKSTLIEAITGTHPDRLSEERDREMSIVLGFDTFQLPDGKEISIVDVPGHRDFIENMLSGIGAIDAALLVIAADEGVMPQTREHLAILDLLEVDCGVVVLTKIDLIDDQEWIDLVEMEIREILSTTAFHSAEIVPVSSKTGQGIEGLCDELVRILDQKQPRPDLNRPRLSVDRAFLISGFGTVVTGTLLDGSFQVGEEVVLLPKRIKGRIRGLQHHNQNVDRIQPGSRAAVNISGVDVKDIERGDLIAHPGDYETTGRFTVRFRYLADLVQPIEHNTEVKIFIGADEAEARVRLLGKERLQPGETGWLQLETTDPIVALRGDHYILRRPSPSQTLGGGIVIEPNTPYRYKRFDQDIISRLELMAQGSPEDVIRQLLDTEGILKREDLLFQSSLPEDVFEITIQKLIDESLAVGISGKGKENFLISARNEWEKARSELVNQILEYHKKYPLRAGMPREELKNQSKLDTDAFELVILDLAESGEIEQRGPLVREINHQVKYNTDQADLIERNRQKFEKDPFTPPTASECREFLGDELFESLVAQEKLISLSNEVVFLPATYQEMVGRVREFIKDRGSITVAETRDLFQSSRRYMLAFLEDLDKKQITVREGDQRRLRK
jgi:selenocysteine-specific elongation factor